MLVGMLLYLPGCQALTSPRHAMQGLLFFCVLVR